MRDARTHALYALLAIALLAVPIWSVPRIPTQDGPSHLYNARIIADLAGADPEPWSEYFRLNVGPRSLPNWFSHGALALLMRGVEPLLAEKLLLTALVALFVWATLRLAGSAGPRRWWVAGLALPLLYGFPLQKGFYNFCFSLCLFCLPLGYWIRHGPALSAVRAGALSVLTLACFLLHPLSGLALLATLGLLWLTTLHQRTLAQSLLAAAALLPAGLLLLTFLAAGDPGVARWPTPDVLVERLRALVTFRFTRAFSTTGAQLAGLLAALATLAAALGTLWRENRTREPGQLRLLQPRLRDLDRLLLVCGAFAAGALLVPEEAAGGSLIAERLPLYALLVLLPWLSSRLPRGLRLAITFAWAASLGLQIAETTLRYLRHQPVLAEALAGVGELPEHATLLPLVFEPRLPAEGERVLGLRHLHAYYCLRASCVSWANYEADVDYFPVRFRVGLERPDVTALEANPGAVDLAAYRDAAHYVLAWAMPPDAPPRSALGRYYRPVLARGRLELFARTPVPARLQASDDAAEME